MSDKAMISKQVFKKTENSSDIEHNDWVFRCAIERFLEWFSSRLMHLPRFWKFGFLKGGSLTLSWRWPLSCRNRSIDWFLYDNGLRHKRVKDSYHMYNVVPKELVLIESFVVYCIFYVRCFDMLNIKVFYDFCCCTRYISWFFSTSPDKTILNEAIEME